MVRRASTGARRPLHPLWAGMVSEPTYGAKCHLCGCLRHDGDHVTEPVPWLRRPTEQLMWCADCDHCQSNALHYMLADAGLGILDPEVRAAVHAFQRGDDHPGLDRLRLVLQAMEVTVDIGGESWTVVDSDLHDDTESGAQHLHLTLTRSEQNANSTAVDGD